MKLTDKQKMLLLAYSKKFRVPYEELLKWVSEGLTTFGEISKGILGMPARPQFTYDDRFSF